jgi:hypothetical protein
MMVGNKIRALRARLMLLVVDDDGMSTVEYSVIYFYTERRSTIASLDSRTPVPRYRRYYLS